MNSTTQTIDFHGESLILHPEGVVWWSAYGCLILSDVHLGKSATFRLHGIPVPEGETHEDLGRIKKLVSLFQADTLVIVGDLIHSSAILSTDFMAELNQWFEELQCRSLLIRGNHDPSPRKLTRLPALENVDRRQIGPLNFVHDPADARCKHPTITGHLHPICRVGTEHGPKQRIPCFLLRDHCLTLPAFGTFTSGNILGPNNGRDTVYPIAGGRVYRHTL